MEDGVKVTTDHEVILEWTKKHKGRPVRHNPDQSANWVTPLIVITALTPYTVLGSGIVI